MNPIIIDRDKIAEVVQEVYGPTKRPIGRPVYRKPYPEWIDCIHELPKGYKVPEFTLFSRHKNQSLNI